MAVTFKDLQDEVITNLHAHTDNLEQVTSLTQDITAGATTLNVDDASQITRGLIEIDGELMWVKSIDQTNNIVTISPFGRGFRETTAAAHTANAMVMNNPRFPRMHVKNTIQEVVNQVYPELFVVKKDETQTTSAVQVTYQLPADCDGILSVSYQTIGASKLWEPIKRYRFDPQADTTAFATGKSIDILQPMFPGRTLKVEYIAAPVQFAADTDTLTSTGLGDGVRDVIVFGTCARLLANVEASRLQITTIEQSERAQLTPPGSAISGSKYFQALFMDRLQDERMRLLKLYPINAHMTR